MACPTVEVAAWKEPQKFDQHGVTDFTAMNLVPFLIVAHCTPEIVAMVKPKADKAKYPVEFLTDQQAITVIDDKVEFLEDPNIKTKDFGG